MDELDPKDLQPQTMLGMKLIQQPFSKMPEAENLFDFDALKQTRDTVSHHLQFSHLLMVIQGRKGSGKKSLANSLIISDHPALYFFNATAAADDDLQSTLEKAAINNNATDIQILEKRIDDIMYRGQQPVLIINDAEQLTEDNLRQLIEYAQQKSDDNQQTQLKLLLLGSPKLEKTLERNGIINHNQFYLIALPQLNVSNTRSFLMHRLTIAGYRDETPFTDKDITNIFNMANGNPKATMEYAAESLNDKRSLNVESISDGSKARKPLLIVGATLFAAAIVYNSILSPEKNNTETETTTEPLTLEKKAKDQLFTANTNTMDVKQEKPGEVLQKLTPAYSVPPRPEPTEPKLPQLLEKTTQEKEKPVVQQPVDIIQQTAIPEKQTNSVKVAPTVKPKLLNTPKVSPAQQAPIKPAIKKVDAITQAFMDTNARTSDWILKQPANNWSLQILAGHEAETLLSYIQQQKLGDKVAYFRKRLGNRDWHVILYGQYKSKEQAKAVIPYLPKYIQQNKPWPKDLKSVQKSIKTYKK